MKTDRLTRVNELLLRGIATAIFRVIKEDEFDLTAVTVTHVSTSSDLRTARVLVSIRAAGEMRKKMLALLQRHRPEIQELLSKTLILKYTPRLSFALDTSVEEGDRVLGLLFRLEPGQTIKEGSEEDAGPDDDALSK